MSEKSSFLSNLIKKIITILINNLGINKRKPTNIQHVVPYNERWAVRVEGSSRVTETFESQEDAIERAKEIAFNYGSSVVIHRKDGTIRDRINL